MKMKIPESFDYLFYLDKYEDIKNSGFNTKEKAFVHWIHYGIKEGRKCNCYVNLPIVFKNNYNKISILIRNTYRPKSFKICNVSLL